jgi:hypothetical protein
VQGQAKDLRHAIDVGSHGAHQSATASRETHVSQVLVEGRDQGRELCGERWVRLRSSREVCTKHRSLRVEVVAQSIVNIL